MSIIKQTYFDQHGTVAGNAIRGAEQIEVQQSHIFYAMQRIENQVEQCGGKFDSLLHKLRVVSRDPKLAQEDNQAMPKREGNSELAQRLNGIMNGLEELDRRITMQLDMLEI
jgi:flagellar biosynthesis/type III secretory pathway chaperone